MTSIAETSRDRSTMSEPAALSREDQYAQRVALFYRETVRPQMDGTVGDVRPEWAIDAETGKYLYDLTRELKPRVSIEVGLCQAASAMHFLSAIAANGSGFHMAIDPFQDQFFQDQGLTTINRLGLAPWFTLLRSRSATALSMLHSAGMTADLMFIDGDHRFDAVFTDYYFADKLLRVGGYLIFDEGGYECPTERIVAFVTTNMPNYERLASPTRLYVFRKTGPDEREFGDSFNF
ncbi:class I SAM-dependent methyltransferase [Sphingomonas arantia]|uniref:Class I SAM-dependent methyltransferase n=1 Tax=Sphingomonas arantia TaxID=1460676 RepID=A0ABW4U409_9SPHN